MSLDADRVRTVTVDSYSTVVDHRSAARALEEHVEEPAAVADVWRDRSLTYAAMSNHLGHYRPFWELLDRALEYALAVHDVELPRETHEAVLAVYRDLDAFPDARPGLERVVEAGYGVYVLSNGSPDMLEAMVENAGIAELVAGAVSADEVGRYKVHPQVYRRAAGRTGTPIRRIAHVTASWFDACGASRAGMQGVWVNRDGAPREIWGPEPDLVVPSLRGLADALA